MQHCPHCQKPTSREALSCPRCGTALKKAPVQGNSPPERAKAPPIREWGEETRPLLGEILVATGVLTAEKLKDALVLQKTRGEKLGTILLEEGFVSETRLAQALGRQLAIPWVRLEHIDVSDDLLNLVPVGIAEECTLFPVHIGKLENGQKALFVAMKDPTDKTALRAVSLTSGMPAKPMVACPSEIVAAIRYYYYDAQPKVTTSAPKTQRRSSFDDVRISKKPPPPRPSRNNLPPVPKAAQKQQQKVPPPANRPAPPERAVQADQNQPASPAMALTLLDGTTIPMRGRRPRIDEKSHAYTREDLIADLRARTSGTARGRELPSGNWENFFAALLEVLFRKHLVVFDELIAELDDSIHPPDV